MAYSRNVFINCPFDDDYYNLLKPLIFTCIYCGLNPQISETKDGDNIRVRQIQQLIESSKFSIHDISRIEEDPPRFNMPFELGLDLGCKKFALKNKSCLILEKELYRYKIVLSDISGQDISNHNDEPIRIIKEVRNWIYKLRRSNNKPSSYYTIWDLYNEFTFDFDKDMTAENLDPNKMWEIPFSELIDLMKKWIKTKKKAIKHSK